MARTEFFYKLSDKLDELFPKGDKRRGDALVLNAFANIFLEEEKPKGHFVMSPYLVESHRVKNKWYLELWWCICEVYTKIFGGAKYLGTPTPVTKEAKRHMKKVHKEKGRPTIAEVPVKRDVRYKKIVDYYEANLLPKVHKEKGRIGGVK